jgi:murein endopeptidase
VQNLPPHYAYQLKGQNSAHPNNHYGSCNAVYRIQQICIQFYNETALRAGVNDMSLPWGGMFDIGPPYGSYWNTPHGTHMAGLNADLPFQYLGTALQRERFRQIAEFWLGYPDVHNGNHYHLTFAN